MFAHVGSEGEVLADLGNPTAIELARGYPEDPASRWWAHTEYDGETWWFPNEQDVMAIACSWSIDPSGLGPATSTRGKCLLGTAP